MTWCRVVFVLAIFLLVRSLADGQEAAKAPFRLDEIIDFHKSDVPCRRLSILIGERGVSFPATPDMIRRLKSAGVCDSAVQTVENVAPPPIPVTAVSDLIEKGNAYLDQGQYAAAGEQFKKAKDSALLAKAERAAAYEKSIAGSDRFPLDSINGLLANLTPKRVSTLVTERGILCVPSETYMQRLESSKVDDRVIVAIEKKGLDNGRQIRKFQDAASSALDQGKYAEAIEEIDKAISLCPISKVVIATRDRARSAQSTEASAKTTPLDLTVIERLLKGHVTPKRVSNLIGERRVNFTTLTEDGEKQLRSAGADNEVIAAIKVNLPAPPRPSGVQSPTPEAAIVMANQGKAILQQSNPNFNEALRTAEEALKIAPNYSDAWVLKGDALRGLKRFKEALASFNQAVALNVNDDTPTLAKRGQVHLDLSQYNGAFQDFDRALKLNRAAPPSWWILHGDSLAGLKRCVEAKESYTRAREQDRRGTYFLLITEKENRLKDCGT